jgi:hypothetical protein
MLKSAQYHSRHLNQGVADHFFFSGRDWDSSRVRSHKSGKQGGYEFIRPLAFNPSPSARPRLRPSQIMESPEIRISARLLSRLIMSDEFSRIPRHGCYGHHLASSFGRSHIIRTARQPMKKSVLKPLAESYMRAGRRQDSEMEENLPQRRR